MAKVLYENGDIGCFYYHDTLIKQLIERESLDPTKRYKIVKIESNVMGMKQVEVILREDTMQVSFY